MGRFLTTIFYLTPQVLYILRNFRQNPVQWRWPQPSWSPSETSKGWKTSSKYGEVPDNLFSLGPAVSWSESVYGNLPLSLCKLSKFTVAVTSKPVNQMNWNVLESSCKIQFNGYDTNVTCHICYMSHVTDVTCHKYKVPDNVTKYPMCYIFLESSCKIQFNGHDKNVTYHIWYMSHVTDVTCHK